MHCSATIRRVYIHTHITLDGDHRRVMDQQDHTRKHYKKKKRRRSEWRARSAMEGKRSSARGRTDGRTDLIETLWPRAVAHSSLLRGL